MSGFADGQLGLVTAEVLANIFRRYESGRAQTEGAGCCQGEMEG